MSTFLDHGKLFSALDALLGKYFKEKDHSPEGKKPKDVFWETYLEAARDEDSARPADWDGNTGSILTFVRLALAARGSLSTNVSRRPVFLLRLSQRLLSKATSFSNLTPATRPSSSSLKFLRLRRIRRLHSTLYEHLLSHSKLPSPLLLRMCSGSLVLWLRWPALFSPRLCNSGLEITCET